MEEPIDKTPYSSNIAQSIEASGNLVNNIKNPSILLIVMAYAMMGYCSYMNFNSVDKLASKIDDLSKSINSERIEHVRETETINRALNLKISSKQSDDE